MKYEISFEEVKYRNVSNKHPLLLSTSYPAKSEQTCSLLNASFYVKKLIHTLDVYLKHDRPAIYSKCLFKPFKTKTR